MAAQEGLTLEVSTRTAEFMIDRGGGPGRILYTQCYGIRVPEVFWNTDITIQHVENWTISADGSVYDNKIDHRSKKMGGVKNDRT
jgi:hypothetical protein